ncbi:Pentatricopeptide repeat-containing protein [Raphanus sativus]|nr:Pentatricopeptide repeat-containing protein [Raphanus sativus]
MSRGQSYLINLIRNRTRYGLLTLESSLERVNPTPMSFCTIREWLKPSSFDYKLDHVSLNLLFGALLDAKAVKAAKGFLDSTGFKPGGIKVYTILREMGTVPEASTCNSVLLVGCLKARGLDRLWELH